MKILSTTNLIGINQVNSVDYVKSAFQIYNSGDVLVILKQSNSGFNLKEERTPNSGRLDRSQAGCNSRKSSGADCFYVGHRRSAKGNIIITSGTR